MSSGSMAVVAVPVVLPVAVGVLAVGGAALLIARAAASGAEMVADGVARLGDAMEAEVQRLADERRTADLWRVAAGVVVEHNAQIAALSAAARTMSVELDLPAPLELAGQDAGTVHAWATKAQSKIERARSALRGHVSDRACRRLADRLGAGDTKVVTVAATLARFHVPAHAAGVAVPVAGLTKNKIQARLAKLDPDVGVRDYEKILETAARARTATSVPAERSSLDLLTQQVHDANAAAERRREDALTAGRHLQAFKAVGIPDLGDSGAARVVARLEAVVAGSAELDDELRAEAERLNADAVCRAQQMYLRETVSELMREKGWEVSGEATVLTLTRADWTGHHVTVDVGDRTVSGRVVRHVAESGVDGRRQDRERCSAFTRDFGDMGAALRTESGRPRVTVSADDVVEVVAPPTPAARVPVTPIQRARRRP
ncbi:hypothetical protein J5X84_31585 [Streptosporangiaceae bacterium NEAU-GS5]|nr:hypothetical protein [Streptosporangiaceae bacterium NEAU-GS5]